MPDASLTTAARLDRIEARLDAVLEMQTKLASRDLADMERFASHERRIAALESWQTWITRLALGAVLTGVLAATTVLAT